MSQQAMQQALRRLLWLIDNEPPVESISRSSWVNNWNVAVGQARASLDAEDAAALKEVPERLTLVDRFDVSGEVWLLLRPKGSVAKGDLVHGGGTIRVEGEFARALSTYFKERDAAMSTHQPRESGGVGASDEARRERLIANGYKTDSRCTWLAIGKCAECGRIHDGKPNARGVGVPGERER